MEFCRICATSTAVDPRSVVNIFEGTEPIANMIHELCGLEILDEYGLPDVVCKSCEESLSAALELKQKCLKSDEKFRQLIQQESILASVYERKADPDVPIISYKILYDQVIEHVPPEIETDYVVEGEASRLENSSSKLDHRKVTVEYIVPQVVTELSTTDVTDVDPEYVVEIEPSAWEKSLKPTQAKEPKTEKRTSKHKLPSTSAEIEITLKVQPDFVGTGISGRQNKMSGSKTNHAKAKFTPKIESDVASESPKQTHQDDDETSLARDTKDVDLPFRCCGCERSFNTKPELLQHSKETHECQKSSNRERPFECTICYKRYTSEKGFKIHRRNAYQLKQHQCSSCGKRFSNRTLLLNHERTHTSQKPFSCTNCPKTFRSRSNLLSHLKLHSDVPEHTKHVCKICQKGFSRKSYLKHHNNLLHSEETPFRCPFCPNRFKAKANLRLHLRTHTQERPYSCDQCEKSFMYPTDKKRHMLQHTGQKPFRCKDCDKAFTRKTLLSKHQASAHRNGGGAVDDG